MGKAARPRTDPSVKLKIRPFLFLDNWFFPISVLSVTGRFAAVSQSFRTFMAIYLTKTQSANIENPLLLT